MKSPRRQSRGFTLVASLLMLFLLSGIAIGLLMMANTESKVGGTDLQNNVAYHVAEGGIEKIYSDLSAVFVNSQVPTANQICSVNSTPPSLVGVSWKTYSVGAPGITCTGGTGSGTPTAKWSVLTGGPENGLWAQVIPINLQVTAAMMGGQEVNMTRTAQVALIPVFQYGVFCEGDCAFFDTPNLNFAGRVHTNGDLYLGVGQGSTLTFNNKLEAYGNIVTEYLPNGLAIGTGDSTDTGNVYIPTVAGGCTTPTTNCVTKATNSNPATSPFGNGSVQGLGGNPCGTVTPCNSAPNSTYNGLPTTTGSNNWNTFSNTTTQNMIVNGNYGSTSYPGTGAKKLSMPFVGGGVLPYEIIRRPPAGESATSAVGTSREYNMAQIRILLSDDPNDLPGGASDSNNVRLANLSAAQAQAQVSASNTTAVANLEWGITIPNANINTATFGTPSGSNTYNLYFAAASNVIPNGDLCHSSTTCNGSQLQMDWPYAPKTFAAASATQGLQPVNAAPTAAGSVNSPEYQVPASGAAAVSTVTGLCPPNTYPLASGVVAPTGCPAVPAYPYFVSPNAVGTTANASATSWSLIDGYLRVEYKNSSGAWNPVTMEWLQLGFARGITPPTANGAGLPATLDGNATASNPINPNAILLLQEPADRNDSGGMPSTAVVAPTCSSVTGTSPNQKCQAWSTTTMPEAFLDLTSYAASSSTTNWAFGLTPAAPVATPQASATQQSITQYNWYPINFYDAREGEARDVDQGSGQNSCSTNGVMNAIEIDVGNLKQWLAGNIGTSGTLVDYQAQNGYILYFSDRRGMLVNPNATSSYPANAKSGDSGLEDVVNHSSSVGAPDGTLDTSTTPSPEDVNQNGVLDKFGTANLGLGFWGTVANPCTGGGCTNLNTQILSTAAPDPFGTAATTPDGPRINSCVNTARKNWVSGARHVLKLVDASLGNVPINPVSVTKNGVTYWGGFTVASENPVYIEGDYNSNSGDNFWPNGVTTGVADSTGHSAAAVIADSVTLLSNNWVDEVSMSGGGGNSDITYRTNNGPYAGHRTAVTSYYRLAIATGKNLAFPFPSWANASPDYPFATDGGMGNFLHLLEDWYSGTQQTLNYGGSMVSLYYSTYNTGLFKCCTYTVYAPPKRNYIFDSDFTLPEGMPPGTPLFRDVESLGFRQLFLPRTD